MSDQNVVAIGGEYRALSPAEIGGAVRGFRERLNLKQLVLAERAGVTERTIQRVERGEPIKDETLKQIAKALFLEEHAFVGLCYIPSRAKAFENALKFLDDHHVVDVHRLHSPEDINALLEAQRWIVDGRDVSREAREFVAILQETLVGRERVNSEISGAERADSCGDLFRHVKRIERAACVGKYGVSEVVVAKVPGQLGILKFWPRDDPRALLSQVMLSKQKIRLR